MPEIEWEGNEETHADLEEQLVLFASLDSFYQYAKVAHFNTTHLRRQAFYALPRAHWELLASPPFNYLETLDAVDNAIEENAKLSHAILKSGLESFGINQLPDPSTSDDGPASWLGKASSSDLEKARSTLRQFYRDWSAEGSVERAACYGPVLEALQIERGSRSGAKLRVLVPGAGLGRLVFDLCAAGFDAEGNEINYHQLLASSYILNHAPQANSHTLYPWVHSFSNHKSRSDHLRYVSVPDLHPATALVNVPDRGKMSMSASDFLLLYGDEEHQATFDAVATVFFLDTAPNVIRYLETIKSVLRPGGLLVNVGPLLWHFENNAPGNQGGEGDASADQSSKGIADPGAVELTDDELMALVEKFGFEIMHRVTGIQAPYIQDTSSMLQNTYQASHWIARKK